MGLLGLLQGQVYRDRTADDRPREARARRARRPGPPPGMVGRRSTSYDPGTGRWTWTARGRHPGRGKHPETITGTGEDGLAAMIDLRIRLDDRRRGEKLDIPQASVLRGGHSCRDPDRGGAQAQRRARRGEWPKSRNHRHVRVGRDHGRTSAGRGRAVLAIRLHDRSVPAGLGRGDHRRGRTSEGRLDSQPRGDHRAATPGGSTKAHSPGLSVATTCWICGK